MDRGAWQTAVHGAAESRTQLSNCTHLYSSRSICFGKNRSGGELGHSLQSVASKSQNLQALKMSCHSGRARDKWPRSCWECRRSCSRPWPLCWKMRAGETRGQARGQQGSRAYAAHAVLYAQLRLPAGMCRTRSGSMDIVRFFFFWVLLVGFGAEVGSQSRSQILLVRRSTA